MGERICSIQGCEGSHLARGLCKMHYARWLKRGDPGSAERQWNPNNGAACSVEDCEKPARSRAWCRMHYRRWSLYGDPLTVLVKRTAGTVDERFWAKVDVSGVCWEWTGSRDAAGYGHFNNGEATVRAHRWSWENLVGPIPDHLTVDHICRNKSCVNPDHFELVTLRENILRGNNMAARRVRAKLRREATAATVRGL